MKHAPATPLPWIVNQRKHVCAAASGFADVATTADGRKAQVAVDDAAYIAHAANAYPRLIDALLSITAFHPDICQGATGTEGRALYDAAALLRELGELDA